MPLDKQLLALPIVGGLDQKSDALLTSRPQQMTNCLYRKTGAVSKRYGYTCIGSLNTRLDGTHPATGELLTPYQSELVRIGGGRLDTYGLVNGTSDWLARGRVPECIVETSGIVGVGVPASTYTNPSLAYASGYIIAAYVGLYSGFPAILADVIDESTGARVYSGYLLEANTVGVNSPKVVAMGGKACVVWSQTTVTQLHAQWLDLATLIWDIQRTVATGLNATSGMKGFDADMLSASEVAIIYELSSGTNRVTVKSFDLNGATVSGPTAVATTIVNGPQLAIRCAATLVWVGVSGQFGNTSVGTMTLALAAGTAPVAVSTGLSTNYTMGLYELTATSAIVAWSSGEGLSWNEISSTGTVIYPTARNLLGGYLISRPLVRNGRAYALVEVVQNSALNTQFILDLSAGEVLPVNASPRIVACLLPRQINAVAPRRTTTAAWAMVNANEYLCVTATTAGQNALNTITIRAKFDGAWVRTATELGGVLTIGGGVLTGYDGSNTFEHGFAYEPGTATLAGAASGSMTASGVYGYKFVYRWTDAAGNTHRSAPSAALQVTLTAGQAQVTGTLPCLQLTNKVGPVYIEAYRTVAAGSTYFLVSSVLSTAGNATVAFADLAADSSINTNASLYTTGGVLPHYIPAGGAHVLAWKGGLITHASDDDSLWISGEKLPGEGPWFNPQLNIAAFEGGAVTALSTLDATPIIFKADSTYYIDGEPPTDLGASNIGSPRRIQTEVGCSDPASVVTTPMGLIRMARTGLYILNRSLADEWIGRAVQGSYRATFAGAALLPEQGLVRWLQRGTGGARDALNYDYYHAGVYQTPVWSCDELYDVQSNFTYDAASPVACALWGGAFVWLSATGYLYRETVGFTDGAYDADQVFVPMTFETAFEKAAGVAAYQRVYRVFVTADKRSPHGANVTLTTDEGTWTRSWTTLDINAMATERMTVHAPSQKCQWMKVRIADTAATGTGEGLVLRDVSILFGVKPGGSRLSRKK